MGRTRLSIAQLLVAAPLVAFFGFAARADGPASWDDQHMRSNFTHSLDPAGPRPPILGVDADGKLARDPGPVATEVKERTLKISPFEWQPGGPRVGTQPDRPAAFSAPAAIATRGSGSAQAPSTSGGMRHAAP